MSPEQVSAADVDGRADLYSTGVLLYQMITGRLPFDADDPTALMGKHLFSEPPPLPAGLPPSLAGVVARLLAKEPVDRYPLASQARAELDIAIRELDVPTPPRPRRARPLPSRAMALGLVLAAGAIGALVWPAAGDDQVAQAGIAPPQGSVQRLPSWIEPPAFTPAHADAQDVQELRGIADPRAALIRVDALLQAAPDDARLHLERARILARSGESDRALADYERAIARDPDLVDGKVLAEIAAFAREPVLQPATLDLALQELGTDALPILVELIADERSSLGYRDRHRALTVLTDSPASASIDEHRMIALDLEQAAEADAPCLVFAAALAAIERDPVAAYRSPLRRALPPSPEPRASVQDVALCAALPDRLARVRALVARENEAATPTKATKTSEVRIAKREAGKSRGKARADKRRRPGVGRLRGLAG